MSIETIGQGQKVLISACCHNSFELYKSLCDGLSAVTPQQALEIGFDRNASYDFIHDARSRFKAWAMNIAALQGAHLQSSLESRLREAPEIRQRILKILNSLAQSLQEASMIVDGSKPNETWDDGAISDLDEDDASNPGETTPTSDLEQLFIAIKTANSNLMKLSMVIRNSPARDDYLKAASRYPFDAKYDIGHVVEKHGSAKRSRGWLLERLGKAITRRRQYLKYREEHHAKLSREWENVTVEETDTREDIDVPPTIANAAEDKTPEKTIALTKVTKATTYVENKAMIERDGIDLDQGSFGSQTSYEPTVIGEAVHKLSVPPPPTMAFENVPFEFGEPFQCPYCYMEVTVKNKTAWKKHVFRDLKPYVCTFPGCNLKMFRSRNEWFAHEIQNHRREWCCIACPEIFTGKAKFSQHLQSMHITLVAESQLEALILQCEEPVDKIPASACPLCDDWEINLLDPKQDSKRLFLNNGEVVEPCGTLNQFRRHLGRHMEQLALFALPMAEEDEMEDDSMEESSDDDLNEEKHILSGPDVKMPPDNSDPYHDPHIETHHRTIIDRAIEGGDVDVRLTLEAYPQLLAHPDYYHYLQQAVLGLSGSNQARITEHIAYILDSTILIENIDPDLKEKDILAVMENDIKVPETLILEHQVSHSSLNRGASRAFARFLTATQASSATVFMNGIPIGCRVVQVQTLSALVGTFDIGPLDDEKGSRLTDLPFDKASADKKGKADDEISAMKRSLAELEDEVDIPAKSHEMVQNDINSRSIFVANLGDAVSLQEISNSVRAHFETCGVINGVTFLVNKFSSHPNGQAYVEFAAPESATQALAMNESIFNGRILQVLPKYAVSRDDAALKASVSEIAVGNTINLEGFGGEVETNDGIVVTLEELVDYSRNGIIIFTYAKASSPEATTGAGLLSDHHNIIAERGFSVFGLSNDTTTANRIFKWKYSLPYLLLSDSLYSLISAIGMQNFQFGTVPGVFIVDKSGKILEATPCRCTEILEVVERVIGALPANFAAVPTAQDSAATRAADDTMPANIPPDEPRNTTGLESGPRSVTTSPPEAGLSEKTFDTMTRILQRISEYRDYSDDQNGRDISYVFRTTPYKEATSESTKVAKFPFALKDISEKITKRQYRTFQDFVWEVSWILHDVILRHSSSFSTSSRVYQDTIMLRGFFEAELKKLADDNIISSADAHVPNLDDERKIEKSTSKPSNEESKIENHPIEPQSYSAAVGASIGTEASHHSESTLAKLDATDADVDDYFPTPGWLRTDVVHLLAVGELSEVELRRKLAIQETYDGSDLQLALKQTLKEVALAQSHGPPAVDRLKWHLRPAIYRELDVWRFPYDDAERNHAIENAAKEYRQLDLKPEEPEWTRLLPDFNQNSFRQAHSQLPHQDENSDIPPLDDAGSINENHPIPSNDSGLSSLNITESDEVQMASPRHWYDPPTIPKITTTSNQPTTSNEATMQFNEASDTISIASRAASWGTRRRRLSEPSLSDYDAVIDGSFLKKLAISESRKGEGRTSNLFDRGLDRIANIFRMRSGSKLKRSFLFRWEHSASEVYVTGTFDNWSKSARLDRIGDVFEKRITLPLQKTYYKFVVDGVWVTNHSAPQETDASGNLNNYLTAEMIAAGTWDSSNVAKESFSEESKNIGRSDAEILGESSPPRPPEQSTQESETYSKKDILLIDRAQPTVTIDPDSQVLSNSSKSETGYPDSPVAVAPMSSPSPEEPEISESHARQTFFDTSPLEELLSMASTLLHDTAIHDTGLHAREEAIRNFRSVLEVSANNGTLTRCIGITPNGTRCRYLFSPRTSEEIYSLINAMVQLEREPSDVSAILQNLARLCLCNEYHQQQASDLVKKWMASIDGFSKPSVGPLSPWGQNLDQDIASLIDGAGSIIEHVPAKQ